MTATYASSSLLGGIAPAYEIIEKINPENPVETPETRGGKAKRAWNALLISAAVMFMRSKFGVWKK